MGTKKIKITRDLPFEEGKTYMTKFATHEMFTVSKVNAHTVDGIYEKAPHLGVCPLSIDRLIADKEDIGEKEVCDCCSQPLDQKYKGKKFTDF